MNVSKQFLHLLFVSILFKIKQIYPIYYGTNHNIKLQLNLIESNVVRVKSDLSSHSLYNLSSYSSTSNYGSFNINPFIYIH